MSIEAKTDHSDRMSKNPVGIKDVARFADVSTATVTRTLSGSSVVKDETRQKVLHAAEVLSYRPNLLARGLRSGKTKTVGVLWSMARFSPVTDVMGDISRLLRDSGYLTQIINTFHQNDQTAKGLEELLQRRVDGVILNNELVLQDPDSVQVLRELKNVVLVSSTPISDPSIAECPIDVVVQNPEPAIRQICDYFIESGRRKIVVFAKDQSASNRFKIRAFERQAARRDCLVRVIDLGVTPDEFYDMSWGSLGKTFLDSGDFDAVFCIPDEVAALLMTSLKREGIRIPQDIMVVGYNDNFFSKTLDPPLSSVKRNDEQYAAAIVRQLLNRINRKEYIPPRKTEIHMEFVIRESAFPGSVIAQGWQSRHSDVCEQPFFSEIATTKGAKPC